MPASLFAEWAGVYVATPEVEIPPTPQVSAEPKASVSASLDRVDLVTEPTAPRVIAIIDPQPCVAGNPGNPDDWAGVTERSKEDQCSSPGNPGNLEYRSYAGKLEAGEPIAWPVLFALRFAHRQQLAHRPRSEAEILAYSECLLR